MRMRVVVSIYLCLLGGARLRALDHRGGKEGCRWEVNSGGSGGRAEACLDWDENWRLGVSVWVWVGGWCMCGLMRGGRGGNRTRTVSATIIMGMN